MSQFGVLPVEEGTATDLWADDPEPVPEALQSPMSKKARARQRRRLQKASVPALTEPQAPQEVQPTKADVEPPETLPPVDPAPQAEDAPLSSASSASEYGDASSSSDEDEGDDDDTQVQETPTVAPDPIPATPRKVKRESPVPPPSQDHLPNSKMRSIITRTVWTFLMFAGFISLILLGHAYVIMLVFFVQAQVFRELSSLFESSTRPHDPTRPHSAAYTLAKEKKRAERARYSKVVTWYFFAVTNYFLYGESIIYYFKHIILMDSYFIAFTQHHRFISFSLWTLGFVGFVTTLKKVTLRRQFGLFCWIHISLFLIVVSSHFIVNSILEGLIWFWLPASLVICNDIMAYVFGMTFGKTPLIQLSPKKTVEGFIGALFATIVFAYFWATLFMRIPYFICPCRDLGMNALSPIFCDPNPVFVWRELQLPAPISSALSTLIHQNITTFPWAPFQLHALVLAVFASLVAPFGGFFASGFKRAFNIKDFGDSIPGHGGMTDRMDCQFLMGMFSYVYYASLIRINTVTAVGLYESAVTSLSREDLQQLVASLAGYLERTTA